MNKKKRNDPEHKIQTFTQKIRERERERERLTDKIANIESVVVGPKSVVKARVPATIRTHNVVSGGDYGGEE